MANVVRIEASCLNCRNKRWETCGEDERCWCTKKSIYLDNLFWGPVCVHFIPKKEVMQNAIRRDEGLLK